MFDAEPDGWEQTTLGAIATLGGGTTPSKSEEGYWSDGSTPWATPSDITSLPSGTARISATEVAVTDRALKECSLPLNPPGTVLMTSRATIGYAALNDVPMATNQGFITFRCGDRADPEFLLHWLTAKRAFLVAAAGGSTFKELSRGTAKLLPILLPPLHEQRRIAEVLRSVDEAVASAVAAVREADRSLKLLAEQLLVTEAEATGGEVRMGDLLASVEAGVSVNSEGRPAEDGEYGVLKTSCVSAARFDPAEHKAVLKNERTRVRVPVTAGSIILSRMNTLDLVGANAFVADDHPNLYLPDRLWLLKTSPIVRCRWLAYYMKTARFRGQIVDIASGTSGSMKNISKGRFAELPIYVPGIEIQDAAVEVLTSVEQAALRSADALESNKLVRESLSGDLLSGRVRVSA